MICFLHAGALENWFLEDVGHTEIADLFNLAPKKAKLVDKKPLHQHF